MKKALARFGRQIITINWKSIHLDHDGHFIFPFAVLKKKSISNENDKFQCARKRAGDTINSLQLALFSSIFFRIFCIVSYIYFFLLSSDGQDLPKSGLLSSQATTITHRMPETTRFLSSDPSCLSPNFALTQEQVRLDYIFPLY